VVSTIAFALEFENALAIAITLKSAITESNFRMICLPLIEVIPSWLRSIQRKIEFTDTETDNVPVQHTVR